ncbi:hypothetical protein MGSAQ_001453 [marine sediment metagenome]|uniref:Uncharacterized protein n=1 Tax=marine sediment metagenome TaxID=412755 RepID=A0A1B6NUC0_9ZZZZ
MCVMSGFIIWLFNLLTASHQNRLAPDTHDCTRRLICFLCGIDG